MKIFKNYRETLKVAAAIFCSVAILFGGLALTPRETSAQFKQPPTFFGNTAFPSMKFTATSQTKSVILQGFSICTISQTSVANTTATWQAKLSNDGGTTYYAAAVAPYVGSATLASVLTATTTTATTAALFVVNVGGFSNLEIVTSGTFTATSVSFQVTCSGNKGVI